VVGPPLRLIHRAFAGGSAGLSRQIVLNLDWKGSVSSLAWSRDGRLAYLEQLDHGQFTYDAVILVEVIGHKARRIRLPFTRAQGLAWSPDGRQLALAARANESAPFDVYTVDLEGRHAKRLTRGLKASGVSWR
jgi:Tol biopolymer transport system component